MKIELKINGMHCGSCAMLIKEELAETDGIASAEVSFESKAAVIEFDENLTSENAISKQINELGYEVLS